MSSAYHRHCFEFVSLVDAVNDRIAGRPARFQYCDICKAIPTSLVALNPRPEPSSPAEQASPPKPCPTR